MLYRNLYFPGMKGDMRALFLLKNISAKEKKTRRGSVTSSNETEEKEEDRTSLNASIHVQLPCRRHPPYRSQSASSCANPSKPVPRVSQSQVKQLSAFAPSPEREKASGHSQIETYRSCKSTERKDRAFSFKADRTLTSPMRLNRSNRAQPFSFLHLCDILNAVAHLLLNRQVMTESDRIKLRCKDERF